MEKSPTEVISLIILVIVALSVITYMVVHTAQRPSEEPRSVVAPTSKPDVQQSSGQVTFRVVAPRNQTNQSPP